MFESACRVVIDRPIRRCGARQARGEPVQRTQHLAGPPLERCHIGDELRLRRGTEPVDAQRNVPSRSIQGRGQVFAQKRRFPTPTRKADRVDLSVRLIPHSSPEPRPNPVALGRRVELDGSRRTGGAALLNSPITNALNRRRTRAPARELVTPTVCPPRGLRCRGPIARKCCRTSLRAAARDRA